MDYARFQTIAKDENRTLLIAFAFVIAVVAATAAAVVTASAWATLRVLELFVVADASNTGREVAESELLTGRTSWGWVYGVIFAVTVSVIVWVSHSRERALIAFGGAGLARSVGGRLVNNQSSDPAERRFVHAVEEMAIAARRPAPAVFVVNEDSINAFNAGWTDEATVIGITNGALQHLSRDELQAVAAQAMSHVFHGDARLNLRLMALVTGVAGLAMIGEDWMERGKPDTGSEDDGIFLPWMVAGGLLYAVGWVGVWLSSSVQRSVASRHELLADATAVELLRQSEPLRDALRRIGGHPSRGRMRHRRARSMNHLFMVDAGHRRTGGIHPDLRLRVLRLDPNWDGEWLRAAPRRVNDVVASQQEVLSPFSPVASATVPIAPSLEPLSPVFDAMSAPIAGLTLAEDHVAPLLMSAALDETPGDPGVTVSAMTTQEANCTVAALVHLATGNELTAEAAPPDCSVDDVRAKVRLLEGSDRVAAVRAAGPVIRQDTDSQAFAVRAVADLDQENNLDHWLLRRIVLGVVVEHPRPRKRRTLKDLRSDFARLLSAFTAIGGNVGTTAFDVGASRAGLAGLHQREVGTLRSLGKSLDKLATIVPADGDRLLQGLRHAMHADGTARSIELEFIDLVELTLQAAQSE